MVQDNGGSWRDQLSVVKDKVVEAKRLEELEEKLQIQRSRDGILEKLKEDTPDALGRQFRALENAFRSGGRELFPAETIIGAAEQLQVLSDKAEFYLDAVGKFDDIFTEAHQQALAKLQHDLPKLKERFDKQVAEWSNVKIVVDGTKFRHKLPEDEPTLAHIAKTFYNRAHGIDLNLPKQFFARKAENFHVATFQDIPYAYGEVSDVPDTFALAVGEVLGTNFTKLARGFMYRWCREGFSAKKLDTLSVRVTSRDEVKFYTGLNFLRSQTRGMSDWIYSRKVT